MNVAEIYRHPVKSLGEEALDTADLAPGRAIPWDRTWALAHGRTEWSPANPVWGRPGNFINQTHVPRLAQIRTAFDAETGQLTLSHPDRPALDIRPGTDAGNAALTDWVAPLTEGTTRQGPFTVCQAPGVTFTDFEDSHISIASVASRRALGQMAGRTLEPVRFRMNIWIDGIAPWTELDLIGREIEIGGARLKLTGRCKRCNATKANPATGRRDVEVPELLFDRFGHMDFGVYAQVVAGGTVRRGDNARLV